MPPPPPELSVVIPAFNEARRIGPSLERVSDFLQGRGTPYEILVADDGSTDGTSAVVVDAEVPHAKVLKSLRNQGKGAAVRRGVLASVGRRVLLSDADLSTPIEDLAKLEERLAVAPVVLGSRAVKDSQVLKHQPMYRELMGKTFNKLIRLAGVWGIQDTQCGFKLLDGEVARRTVREPVYGM